MPFCLVRLRQSNGQFQNYQRQTDGWNLQPLQGDKQLGTADMGLYPTQHRFLKIKIKIIRQNYTKY
jgi:hypothetical protein